VQTPDAEAPQASRLRRSLPIVAPVVVYLALGCLAFWPIAPWDAHRLPVCNCADYAKMTAFLEWTPWAIAHGHNPFFTTYQDYPAGVNLALNTSMPFLGLVLAPVTLTTGPIAAMNLLARIALAGSAITGFFVFRRWVRWTPAAALGGLLFGFSPYVMAHAVGHPNLIFVVLLPVLLLLVDEVVVRQRARPRNAGLLLGIVAAAQYGISSELLADGALLTAVALVLLAILWRPAVRQHLRHLARSTAWSLASFVPLAGYPIVMSVAGPRHLTGPVQSLGNLNPLRSDLLGAFVPTSAQLISPGRLGSVGSTFAASNFAENATYVGVPLVVLVVAVAVAYRRDARLLFMTLMAAITYLVSLGVTLNVYGHVTGVPLPYRILVHLPLLDGATAVRFFAYGYLFLALVLALGLDHLRGTATGSSPARWGRAREAQVAGPSPEPATAPSHRGGRRLRPALCLIAGVAVLVPLVPRLPLRFYPSNLAAVFPSDPVPAYFTGSGEQAIPNGSLILVYPYSTSGDLDYSVLWQAAGAERFRLTDGDATVPGPDGAGAGSPELEPPLLEQLLTQAYFGPDPAPTVLALTPSDLAQVRAALRTYGFSTVVVAPVGRFPDSAVSLVDAALGSKPIWNGGVWVWYGVQSDLRHVTSAL
jgi:hypothetical protein